MIHKIFTVFDQKAKAHLPPFFLHNEAMAIREFADCANNPEHQFGKHPEDYVLMTLGTFDDEKGLIDARHLPEVIGRAQEYVIVDPDEEEIKLKLIEDSQSG